MKSMCVTASQFQKGYRRYASLARRQAVTITNHGRAELVVLDAEEYERLPRLDSRVAMPVEALSKADLDRLEQSKIPEGTKKLDHLTRESAADDVRYDDPEPSITRSSADVRKNPHFCGAFLGTSQRAAVRQAGGTALSHSVAKSGFSRPIS
jgi:PHD/YefM family antitoxin component YafN of YafNO toxin-antitoxin module